MGGAADDACEPRPRSQVRNGLSAGGRRIRTVGPSRARISSVIAPDAREAMRRHRACKLRCRGGSARFVFRGGIGCGSTGNFASQILSGNRVPNMGGSGQGLLRPVADPVVARASSHGGQATSPPRWAGNRLHDGSLIFSRSLNGLKRFPRCILLSVDSASLRGVFRSRVSKRHHLCAYR